MTQESLQQLKYPIGQFQAPDKIEEEHLQQWVQTILFLPQRVRQLTENLSEAQLQTPYRPEGWTVKQVVHHLADSHANSLVRFKLALTEDNPLIRPYEEAEWAKLNDYNMPISASFTMLEGIHARWAFLLESLTNEQWGRTFKHPEHEEIHNLKWWLGMYDWHSRHHYAHMKNLAEREGWLQ